MTTPHPRLESEPVTLPDAGGPAHDLWVALMELANRLVAVPWTIVGGQMVLLHALEHGATPLRLSADLDAAVDVRTDPKAMQKVMTAVLDLGFASSGTSPEGIAHRFQRNAESGTTSFSAVQHTTATDRRRVRNARRRLTDGHPVWRQVPRPNDARAALEILSSSPAQ